MIQKEYIKTRKDGVDLFKIFSNNNKKILNIDTGKIFNGGVITIFPDELYEELEEDVEIYGAPKTYADLIEVEHQKKLAISAKNRSERLLQKTVKVINNITLTNQESLKVKDLYPTWESMIGEFVNTDFKILYNDSLWKVRQPHTILEIYPPGESTASLYEVIDEQHEGTKKDPIPYKIPMEIFSGKYYTQNSVLYKCTRDSGIALSHNLTDLIGLYVTVV